MRALVVLAIAIHGAAASGCSLLFTKGPPPPCTSSNDAPRADTALAVASVVLAVAGGSIVRNPQTCTESWCGLGGGATGGGMLIAGGIGSVVFASSAIVGYNRTAGCREAEENGLHAQHPPPGARQGVTVALGVVPAPQCSSRGDAPLVCFSKSSKATALAMDGVGR